MEAVVTAAAVMVAADSAAVVPTSEEPTWAEYRRAGSEGPFPADRRWVLAQWERLRAVSGRQAAGSAWAPVATAVTEAMAAMAATATAWAALGLDSGSAVSSDSA
jgi:hypothetical protein